jgi:hypothetical protein
MTEITTDVLESYLKCKFKAHLLLNGQHGSQSEFEDLLNGLRAEVRLQALDKILGQHSSHQVERGIVVTRPSLKRGAAFVFDATLDDEPFQFHLDGLKRVEGSSKLGSFHYVPMLFHESARLRKDTAPVVL